MTTTKLTRKEKIAQGLPKPPKKDAVRKQKRIEWQKSNCYAKLNDYPSSPRKMRLVADLIRGKDVQSALYILKLTNKAAAEPLKKLLLSALANWEKHFANGRTDYGQLIVSRIFVDQGKTLKRLRPAPQGRAYRVRKRSNHVTLFIDSLV